MSKEIVSQINEVVAAYFKANPKTEWIPAKAIMPSLIKAGVFIKDVKKGLPLRKVLRSLDQDKALDSIPLLHVERNENTIYWYFVREGGSYTPKEPINEVTNKQKAISRRESSDEYYLIGLINELLDTRASHQHTFDFLLGDYHKNGKTRTELPLDAYYAAQNLVIEFLDKSNSESVNRDKMTISGVKRSEQRDIYRQRKQGILKANDINLIEVDYARFDCDTEQNLSRNKENDVTLLKEILKHYIK
jgi:hypothetical protein